MKKLFIELYNICFVNFRGGGGGEGKGGGAHAPHAPSKSATDLVS